VVLEVVVTEGMREKEEDRRMTVGENRRRVKTK